MERARSMKVFVDLFENAMSPWIVQIGSRDLLSVISTPAPTNPSFCEAQWAAGLLASLRFSDRPSKFCSRITARR